MLKITVIIPTFNSINTIHRCLNSIKKQEGNGSHFNLEILIVDDHSTDGTWEYLNQEKEIILLKNAKHGGGPNFGRNLGLKQASGDYIALMDHDDEWLPTKLIQQLKVAPGVDIITTDFKIIDEKTGRIDIFSTNKEDVYYYKTNELFLKILRWEKDSRNPHGYMSTLLLRGELKSILFEENFGWCDFDYLLKLTHNRTAMRIQAPLVNRYVKGNNLSLNPKYRRMVFYYNQMILEEYEENFPKEVKIGRRGIFGTHARYYYTIGKMKKARKLFLRSHFNWKTVAYVVTSFIGEKWVKKTFRIFGS